MEASHLDCCIFRFKISLKKVPKDMTWIIFAITSKNGHILYVKAKEKIKLTDSLTADHVCTYIRIRKITGWPLNFAFIHTNENSSFGQEKILKVFVNEWVNKVICTDIKNDLKLILKASSILLKLLQFRP